MKHSIARILLACVLVFAVSLQAVASASALSCGLPADPDSSIELPRHVESVAFEHDSPCAEHHIDESKCKSSAPCCTASALIGQNLIFIDHPVSKSDFPAVQTLHWPALANLLERPPRVA